MKKLLLLCCVSLLGFGSVFALYQPTLKDWKAINTLEPMLEELLENDEQQFAFIEQFLEGAANKFDEDSKKGWLARELLERMSDIEDAAFVLIAPADYIDQNTHDRLNELIHIEGNPDARISIVTFSDYECPYCKKFNNDQVVREVINTTNELFGFEIVNRAVTHFPLSFHEYASFAANVAECVGKEHGVTGFYAYTDMIFEQERINETVISSVVETVGYEQRGIDSSGYDVDGIIECATNQTYNLNIIALQDIARELGAGGTPVTFIIDNETLEFKKVTGAVPASMIEDELGLMIQ